MPNSDEVVSAVTVRILRVDPVASYGFFDDELHIGAGLRFALSTPLGYPPVEASFARSACSSTQTRWALRRGASGRPRAPASRGRRVSLARRADDGEDGRIRQNEDGDRVVGNIYLPTAWSCRGRWKQASPCSSGSARSTSHGRTKTTCPKRKANPTDARSVDKKEPSYNGARRLLKERFSQDPRERVLLSFSTLFSGPVRDAVGLESMLSQTIRALGRKRGRRIARRRRGGGRPDLARACAPDRTSNPHAFVRDRGACTARAASTCACFAGRPSASSTTIRCFVSAGRSTVPATTSAGASGQACSTTLASSRSRSARLTPSAARSSAP